MPKTSAKVTEATKPKVSSGNSQAKAGAKGKTVGKPSSGPVNMIKKKHQLAKRDNPLFEKRTRNYGIGNHIQPKRDLTFFVKWPKYIRVQRQKRILLQRLKIPGTINQFNITADKNTTHALFKLLALHRPETKHQKKARLLAEAKEIVVEQQRVAALRKEKPGEKVEVKHVKKVNKKPKFVKYGLRHVTSLVESRKAQLVIIANDVDPLELVLWLPTLCKKKDIPYIIVKGKAALGRFVHKKTAAALVITDVKKSNQKDLDILIQKARENYLDRYSDVVKKSGGQVMGAKHVAAKAKLEKQKAKERATKALIL
jgi:large subunit ribosomal protein L7Ae